MYKSDIKEKMVEVFQDTRDWYETDPCLRDAVSFGRLNTRLYREGEDPEVPIPESTEGREGRTAGVLVTDHKTFETAMELSDRYPGKKIAVLNFASATRPGGGVLKGSRAQEESLCRCSTLYSTLDRKWLYDQYYTVNRNRGDARYSDACIYSPGVIICKTDDSIPVRMKKEDWRQVDVISCAAPNLRRRPSNMYNPGAGKPLSLTEEELFDIHVKRAGHIFRVAAANHVDLLVLGAFGCGAFQNDPRVVARAYRQATEEFRGFFDVIAFAVYCTPKDRKNYDAFKQYLGDLE